MHLNKDHISLDENPNQIWENYPEEETDAFWSQYDQALQEAKIVQRSHVPAPTEADKLALVYGDVFLESQISPTQVKPFRKAIRKKRNGISLPMRLLAPVFGFTLYMLNQLTSPIFDISIEQVLMIGTSLGGVYSIGTLIEDHLYINKQQKALLGTKIKVKGEEIIVDGIDKPVDLRYIAKINHDDIGISLIPYREKQWNTTKPVLVIPKYIEGYDEVVKYIETIVQKYRGV